MAYSSLLGSLFRRRDKISFYAVGSLLVALLMLVLVVPLNEILSVEWMVRLFLL